MTRLWPKSLTGQMLLAVALALLLVQGLGAFLLYRAQSEMREAGLVHAAAFKLVTQTRGPVFGMAPPPDRRGFRPERRGFRVERKTASPLRSGEQRLPEAESRLATILANQGLVVGNVQVVMRPVTDDPVALARTMRGPDHRTDYRHDRLHGRILLAAVQIEGSSEWLVARIRSPRDKWDITWPLLMQTLLIYIVLVGAVAFILRRITRPLAALTGRVELFAQTRDAEGQIPAEGPEDIRRLIVAHNAMEDRISALIDEKDVMLGAIGHDLKTPLAALRVRIESVEDEAERTRMAATIEDIVRALDDILSLARAGRPSDPQERTELSALVAAVVEEFEDMGEQVDLGETSRIVLDLRPSLLRRALRNLVSNALRYGGQARVSLSREDGSAVICIEDDGPGIPESDMERMMDPFTRGDPSRNRETGGAGLGLALARTIAEQHGGRLRLANRRTGNGTIEGLTARLELPLN